ncbi:uncharacterized protein [Pithys albifrons albifrons]|uniref:uncharacterized protein n=1 Tax=Pithys albifrons albifrons TaxID=3385563 RepID=UPI003A5CEF46
MFEADPFSICTGSPLSPPSLLPFSETSWRWDFGAVSLRGGVGGTPLGFAGCAAFAPRRGALGVRKAAQRAEGCAGAQECLRGLRAGPGVGLKATHSDVFSLLWVAGHGTSCALLPLAGHAWVSDKPRGALKEGRCGLGDRRGCLAPSLAGGRATRLSVRNLRPSVVASGDLCDSEVRGCLLVISRLSALSGGLGVVASHLLRPPPGMEQEAGRGAETGGCFSSSHLGV